MRNKNIFIGLMGLLILALFVALVPFGCSTSSDNLEALRGGGNTTGWAGTAMLSGKVTEVNNTTPVDGATCTLTSEAKDESVTVTYLTNETGQYVFYNLSLGNYTMVVTKSDHVTTTMKFTLTENTELNTNSISYYDWNTYMGNTGYPYDATSGYLEVQALVSGTPVTEVQMNCSPADYLAKGYVGTSNQVDFGATATSEQGKAFFYKVNPSGGPYSITATKTSYNFAALTNVTPIQGQVLYLYITGSGGPTTSPSSTVTVSPSGSPTFGVGMLGAAGTREGTRRIAFGLAIMLALSCIVLIKKY
ncbi:MAG: carboxypeptidase-like regulatory domain-containing protein [Candidatus Xenobiia bacterium LiM19]